jgi:hypothetical protein
MKSSLTYKRHLGSELENRNSRGILLDGRTHTHLSPELGKVHLAQGLRLKPCCMKSQSIRAVALHTCRDQEL